MAGYSYKSKNGETYYLHNKGMLYFFSREPRNSIDLPKQFVVIESKRTGLPLVKNRK